MKVSASRPTSACSCERAHKWMSFLCPFFLFQQCPTCLIPRIWLVCGKERKKERGSTTGVFCASDTRICKNNSWYFLSSSPLTFSLWFLFERRWCHNTVVQAQLQYWKYPIVLYKRNHMVDKLSISIHSRRMFPSLSKDEL